MFRTSLLASTVVLWSLSLAGCHIYLGDRNDNYTYCDDTGCYVCDDWGCYPSGGGEGWTCDDNYDCAAGCYCNDAGFCEEAGFCTPSTAQWDCPAGFECDDRGSCVPEGTDPSCSTDLGCPEGSYCDVASGQCVDSATCDMSCAEGFECDEARNTCVPVDADAPLCQAEVLCDELPPTCAEGTNPGIVNGCWNGQCVADADCPDGAPVFCSDHKNEDACFADDRCDAVYRGINCTDPNGASCTSSQANCTCESFAFQVCVDSE
jgi:hypothetical protein